MSTGPDRARILAALREQRKRIEDTGVTSLALFGSVARGDSTPGSDIDLAAVWDDKRAPSLLDRGRTASVISDVLGTDDFDLADETRLRPWVQIEFDEQHVRIW